MISSRVGREVYCKRNGTRGTIVSDSAGVIIVETEGVNKTITESTFKRWYTFVPQENTNEPKDETSVSEAAEKPAGEVGVGLTLRNKFIDVIKACANQQLDFTYDPKNKRDIVKYNGKNVFECTIARRRFTVLCHPKALTPDNLKRADRIFPKEWGWSLSAKFVFTDLSQLPLMKAIITDSLFFRHLDDASE